MPLSSEEIMLNVGTGIVAVPNEGKTTLKVYPQELIADTEGNVTDATDIAGMTEADLITCEFHNTHPYQTTVPHLVEGDVVTLLRHTDTQIIFWQPFKKSLIRKIAKVQHAYPAKQEDNVTDSEKNNYIIKLDTEAGLLGLFTSKDREEPVGFNIALNTKAGIFAFEVDNGEIFRWNAAERELTLITKKFKLATEETYIKGKITLDGDVRITKTLKTGKAASIGGNLSVKGGIKAITYVRAKLGKFLNL